MFGINPSRNYKIKDFNIHSVRGSFSNTEMKEDTKRSSHLNKQSTNRGNRNI